MSDQANPTVQRILLDALREQITHNDPPDTALTLARLQSEGIAEDEAWRWLSAALLQEMALMIRDQRPFDRGEYIAALNRLPYLIDR